MWPNNVSDKRPVSRIYKEISKLNNKKSNRPTKNGQKIWMDISPKKIYKWQIRMWKYAHFISNWGNANQTHNERELHTY